MLSQPVTVANPLGMPLPLQLAQPGAGFPIAPALVSDDARYLASVLMSQQGRQVPRSIKLPTLGQVALLDNPNNCTKDGLAFQNWLRLVQSALLGHNCVQLATHEPPLDLTSSDGTWWVQTNAVLFNALCLSVPEKHSPRQADGFSGTWGFV